MTEPVLGDRFRLSSFRLEFLRRVAVGRLAVLAACSLLCLPTTVSAQSDEDPDAGVSPTVEPAPDADADADGEDDDEDDSDRDEDENDGENADAVDAADDEARSEDALAAPPPASNDEDEDADALAAPPPDTVPTGESPASPTGESAPAGGAAAEEASAAAAPAPPSAQPRVWRNSFFFWSNDVSAYTFLPNTPNAPDTYNPYYGWSFSLQPRWYVGPSLFLRLRQDASIEWTQSDLRTRDRELVFSDTTLDLLEGNLANLFGITFSLGGRFIVPTSISSQNNTMTFGAGLIGLARYSVPDVLRGLTLIASGAFTYRHFDKNTGSFQNAPRAASGNADVLLSQTIANQPATLGLGFSAVLAATDSLFLSGSFSWGRGWAWGLAGTDCVTSDGDGTSTNPCSGGGVDPSDAENRRDSFFFSLGASYQFNPWLNIGLSMSTPKLYGLPSLNERNPIFNYDTSFSLTTQITLDELYSQLFENKEAGRTALPGQPF